MGGQPSVIISNIFATKMEDDIVFPFSSTYYNRFFDDIINKRLKDEPVLVLLNSYHRKIKFTIEVNPTKFLDTELYLEDEMHKTKVFRKETKVSCMLVFKSTITI